MTAIKHTLQREVFLPSEERLVAVVHVTKPGRKKKASFLCAAVTTEKPIQANIYQVKKQDRGDTFKKKLSWSLRELKVLDAKDATKDTAEFELQFDKAYKWIASSIQEKLTFIQYLWKLCQRYLIQKPEFLNIPEGVLEELGGSLEGDQAGQEKAVLGVVDSDWHALSEREEADIEMLMSECDYAISNAEAFSDQLSKDLSVLDGANIHSIMGCEDQVLELMVLLDKGVQEAVRVEERLEEYDLKLKGVKDLMEFMKDKDTLIQVKTRNNQKLLQELDSLVNQLDLDHEHMKALLDGDLSSSRGIEQCSQAAIRLQHCTAAEIHPSLSRMAAVQEQRKRFTRLKATFAMRLAHHLNNLFIHQGNEMCETLSQYASELTLPRHAASQRDLLPYADLMAWLKTAEPESFEKLAKVYTSSLSRLYDREVKEFMESAKLKLTPSKLERKGSLLPSQRFALSDSVSSLHKAFDGRKSGSTNTLNAAPHHGSDVDLSGNAKLDQDGARHFRRKYLRCFLQIFQHVLNELAPVCLAEQDFCVHFFQLAAEGSSQVESGADGSASPQKPTSAKQRQINTEVRKMMAELFPSLESEIISLIEFLHKLNTFNSLYMLVRMSEHVINAEDTGSFLSKTFGNCLVQIKRNFDKFIQIQIHSIQESKLSKKSKVGIVPFVHSFEDFAQQAENIFRGSDRRTDLDKAYGKLISAIFEQIGRLASESQKTPSDVVLFENYHHIFSLLSQLKISCLETQKKEAKHKYHEYTQSYVIASLGRPLEKLHTFIEGIENRVATGVKYEEISYQLAYSKQEIRKVIHEYPVKEVKKGLDSLYKKLDKHLCEEESLQQVVWHSMQDEFIKQYKHYETLIARCYPASGISLEFTITDLLGFFSDIAQSH